MKKILLNIVIFFLVCTSLLGCFKQADVINPALDSYSSPKSTGTIVETFLHNGIIRDYILYIPKNLPQNAPLVIGMHGYTSSPWTFKDNFGWDIVAEENKFIMCYPQGTMDAYDDYSHWNARLTLSTVDDVGFISDLALSLADKYQLNTVQIFATGFSNGGFMAYTLACERPDVFRAVASVSGLMSKYTWENYNPYNLNAQMWLEYSPSTPIPICHIHGTGDSVIPIDGTTPYPTWSGGLGTRETVEFWAGINECTQKEIKMISNNVLATYYINPNNNNQVWYYEYTNWNHFWPSKNYKVDQPSEINAQEIIWEFFSLY